MYIHAKKGEYTMKQMAYARRILGGQGVSKKDMAIKAGYSPNAARSVTSHIEERPGFVNAMGVLAKESGNVAMGIMAEFKARGFKDFENKDLINALTAIGSAWSKFNAPLESPRKETPEGNRLRTVVLQQIENQNLQVKDGEVKEPPAEHLPPEPAPLVGEVVEEGPMDF